MSKLIPIKCTDLRDQPWEIKEYGVPCALGKVDLMRYPDLRWTYNLIIEVTPTPKGVDNNGARASGQAECAVIDGHKKTTQYPLAEIGSIISTPFGLYRIEWNRPTDHDNIKLFELKEQ